MTTKTIQYTERMVGAGHPVYSDTLNRLTLVSHNTDGSHKGYVEASQYSTTPSTHDGLQQAILTVPSTTQIVVTDTQTITGGTVINNPLEIKPGGMVYVASGTVTINGSFSAGLYQCFSGSDTVTFGSGAVTEVCPEWWGIDGVADDVEIQKAINSISSGVVVLNKSYVCSNTITLNVSKYRVVGKSAILNFSSLSSGDAILVTGNSTGTPYHQTNGGMEGVEIIGPGTSSAVIGMRFYSASEAGPSHSNFSRCNVNNFGIGVRFESNSYAINFIGCDISSNGTAISMPTGYSNYGERLTFHACTIFNNTTQAVYIYNSSGAFHFTDCSLDYNAKQVTIEAGRVFLNNCHIEASDYTSAPITVSARNGNMFEMRGGWLLATDAQPNSFDYVITVADAASVITGALFDGVFINNMQTTSGYFAGDVGPVKVINCFSYDTSNNPQLLSANANLLADGGFETAWTATNALDNWFIFADTVAITSRITGTNIQATRTTTAGTFRTGVAALQLHKVGGAGTNASFMLAIPIRPGDRAAMRLYYKRPGTEAGNIIISTGYGAFLSNSSGVPIATKVSTHATTTIAGGAATSWVVVSEGEPTEQAPYWATHYYINTSMFAVVGAADFYIDDVEVTIT